MLRKRASLLFSERTGQKLPLSTAPQMPSETLMGCQRAHSCPLGSGLSLPWVAEAPRCKCWPLPGVSSPEPKTIFEGGGTEMGEGPRAGVLDLGLLVCAISCV